MQAEILRKVLPPAVSDETVHTIHGTIQDHAQNIAQGRRLLMCASLHIRQNPEWSAQTVTHAMMQEVERYTRHKTTEVKADVDVVHDTVTEGSAVAPGQHKCAACESKGRPCFDTSFTVKQVRSCDEPPSVFVRCRQCGKQWSYNG